MTTSAISENGFRYALRRASGKVAWCSLSVRCGTRAETGLPEGIAHFLEHTIFKGTETRSAVSINSCLDKLGGELNAYTTKEEIVLHATVLKEDLRRAVDLLLDIAFNATFPQHEIDTERGVVIDEIISYRDCPADDILDVFEKKFFASHPLGRLTLGTEESVGSITREDLLEFRNRFFVPENVVLSIVADIDEAVMARKVEARLSSFPARKSYEIPLAKAAGAYFDQTENRNNHEANAVIGALAPSLYEEKERIAAVLLCNILGGPAGNSLLNAELREKKGLVYGVECAFAQYSDCGSAIISLGCEKENLGRCLKAVDKILRGLQDGLLPERRLAAAKRQILGQLAISGEGGENQCLSMGKSMLAFGKVASDEVNRRAIMAVSADDIQAMARRIWAQPSKLIFL